MHEHGGRLRNTASMQDLPLPKIKASMTCSFGTAGRESLLLALLVTGIFSFLIVDCWERENDLKALEYLA